MTFPTHTGSPQTQAGPAARGPWSWPDLGLSVPRTPPCTGRDPQNVSDRRTNPQQKGWHSGCCDPDRTPAQVSQSQGEGEREGERQGERERGERRVGEVCPVLWFDEEGMLGILRLA